MYHPVPVQQKGIATLPYCDAVPGHPSNKLGGNMHRMTWQVVDLKM